MGALEILFIIIIQLLKMENKTNRRGSNRGPSAYQHSALPLGQTGSHREEDKKKEDKMDIFKRTLAQPKTKLGPIVAPDDGLVR